MKLAAVVLTACASAPHSPPPIAPDQIVSAADRSEHDRKLDASRKPADTLTLFGIGPGMHVADLGAGNGYTTELLARAVGPNGHVIAQDSPSWDGEWLQNAWKERTAKPVMANTTHVMRAWDDPLPPEARELDAVTFVCAYHDVAAEKKDANQLDKAVFAALKHGGVFVVIDNSAKDGTGSSDSEKFHRIDEATVRDEVTKAGFKLVTTADFLRNPGDTRDWNADPSAKDPRARTQDRFVLKFVKP
jgi:predicted methyltransferase